MSAARRQLLQNCLYVPEKDLYLVSTHVHDYVTVRLDDGMEVATDGGRCYLHRTVHRGAEAARVVGWDLYEGDPFPLVASRLLWGTRGPKGDQPLRYRPIASLTLDHLKAILATQPQIKGGLVERVVKHWIKQKS